MLRLDPSPAPETTSLLSRAPAQHHLVQFYGEEEKLLANVGQYLREGAAAGDWAIVLATPEHREALTRRLETGGVDVLALVAGGRLQMLDAAATLDRLMTGDTPDPEKFEAVVGSLVRATVAKAAPGRVRAYGEMVDLLWRSGRLHAATRLEQCWNRLLDIEEFCLLCAYTIDLLAPGVSGDDLRAVIESHSHLLPVSRNGELGRAVDAAFTEVLGAQTAEAIRLLIRATHRPATLPPAEAAILWLKSHLPRYAEEVLARARLVYERECSLHPAP